MRLAVEMSVDADIDPAFSHKMRKFGEVLLRGDGRLVDHHDVLFEFIVTAVSDTIIVGSTDSKNRRCVYAQIEDYPSMTDAWIEGIGSIQKGISGVWRTMAVGSFLQLIKCTDGDTILYISDTFEDENISDIKSPGLLREQHHAIYDLQGRRLPLNGCKQQHTPQKGVYIQNGKKYIVK